MVELKGITRSTVEEMSKLKGEPNWMLEFRLKSLEAFDTLNMPNFGPKLDINFDDIIYYKRTQDEVFDDWNKIDENVKQTFDNLGVIDAEKKYLGGIGTQYESEVIYHNMLQELKDKNVIFVSTDTALKEYPDIFKKYFNKLVKYNENKFTALNGAVWSGGTFIYIPPHTVLDRPLQSYFRINSSNMGQFERTIIVVGEGSSLHYIEGCTAPTYTEASLHAAVVEIYVEKNAKCRYTTIQNWANNVYNLVTKRAVTECGASMEWIDGNIGSKVTMKYPCVVLKGDNSSGTCITIAAASSNQVQDTGAKMIHIGKNTKSNIISKSIASNKGNATYRGKVHVKTSALNSKSTIKCDTIMLDDISKSDTIPNNTVENDSSILEHEATISKISEEKLFYLMARGIDETLAKELIVMGFIDEFKKELPMEYAVELNQLLKRYISK